MGETMTFPEDYLTDFFEDTPAPVVSWKIRFITAISELPFIDALFRNRANLILDQAGLTKYIKENGIYLDVGTGLGHFIDALAARKNIQGIGVDPVNTPLRKVMRRLKAKNRAMPFYNTGGENVPVRDCVVDGGFLFFVLHHIPYDIQKKIILEMNRVMKPGGRLFLIEDVPETKDDWKRIEKWDARLNLESDDEEHYYRYDKEWVSFLAQHGFTLIENVPFESQSPKKNEGVIPHRCYVLTKK